MINRTNKNVPMYLSICCLSSSSRGSGCLGVSYIWLYLTPDLPPTTTTTQGPPRGPWRWPRRWSRLGWTSPGWTSLTEPTRLVRSEKRYQFSHHLFVDFRRPSTTVSLFQGMFYFLHIKWFTCASISPVACDLMHVPESHNQRLQVECYTYICPSECGVWCSLAVANWRERSQCPDLITLTFPL